MQGRIEAWARAKQRDASVLQPEGGVITRRDREMSAAAGSLWWEQVDALPTAQLAERAIGDVHV